MKNLRMLTYLILGLIFSFTSCEVEDDNQNPSCPELSFKQDGKKLVADFEGLENIRVYEWFINDELVETEDSAQQRDNVLDLTNYNPGTYTVCLKAETPDCPNGTEFCKEIRIEEIMDGCPQLKFTRDGEYLFADFDGVETLEFYAWQVSGEPLENDVIIENEGTNNQGDNKFSLADLKTGTYTVCLLSESATCTSTTYCEDIVISTDEQDDCPEVSHISEANIVTTTITGVNNLDDFTWFVNDQSLSNADLMTQGTTVTVDLSNYNPGTYEVCVKYTSNTCTQQLELCTTVQVTDDNGGDACPDLSFIIEGNILFASFPGIDQLEEYKWFVDGQLVETENSQNQNRDNTLDISTYNPGTYMVCIISEASNSCPNGAEFCAQVTVPEPQAIDCSVFDVINHKDKIAIAGTISIYDIEDNSVIWTINGTQVTPVTPRVLRLVDHVNQSGSYEICYKAVSTTCGTLEKCITIDYQN